MNSQKILWEALAKENSKYYINSDKGRTITEQEFRESGQRTYKEYIADDKLINCKTSILDYGCGTGRLMRSDKQKDMGRWWSGVEYNEESIRKLYKTIGFTLLKLEHRDKYAFWLWLKK